MLVQKTIKLHRAQAAFRRSEVLYRAFVGGRGAGKSWCGAYDLIRRAKRDRLYLVCAPTYPMLKDATLRTFLKLASDLNLLRPGDYRRSPPPSVTLSTGAEILFRSTDDPDRLRGPNFSGAWLDEASLMTAEVYQVVMGSLRQNAEQGWMSTTFTPKGLSHWTYEFFGKPRPDTELFHARTRDNPFNPPGFHDQLARQYVARQAAQELEGLFLAMEGVEWPADYFGSHLFFDDWPPDLRIRVLALDPSKGKADKSGDYSAFVLLGWDGKQMWVDADLDNGRPVEPLESAPERRSIVEDGLQLFRAWGPQAFLVETNGFQSMVADALARAARERGLHLPVYTIDNTVPKVQRIRTLGTFFAQRRIRVRNSAGGRMLVAQLRDFPVGDHDDGPDALHLAVEMLDVLLGQRQENKGGPNPLRG